MRCSASAPSRPASSGRTASSPWSTWRRFDVERLTSIVGSRAEWLLRLSHGIDDRPVQSTRKAKSSSSERTFAEDLTDLEAIRTEIDGMARRTAAGLGRRRLAARTVTIKVRYDDFTTITRSDTRTPPTAGADEIARRAVALLERTEAGSRPVRLLGAGVHNFTSVSETAPALEPDAATESASPERASLPRERGLPRRP